MTDEKYIPYVDGKEVFVLFWRNGFAIKSNFNNTNDFRNLTQAKKFCEYQNAQLKGESDEM